MQIEKYKYQVDKKDENPVDRKVQVSGRQKGTCSQQIEKYKYRKVCAQFLSNIAYTHIYW